MSDDSPLILPLADDAHADREEQERLLSRDRKRAIAALGGLIVIVVAFTSFLMLNKAPQIVAAPQFVAPAIPPESVPGVDPVNKKCPAGHPAKGDIDDKDGERRVYTPETSSYAAIVPERCFAEFPDALMEGYRTAGV
jgi:hypothetical protein